MWELPVWQTDYNDKETYFLGMLEFSPQINLRSLPLSTFQWSNCCGQLGTWAHENRRQRALVKAYGADRALDRCFREERKTYTHIIASRYDTKYALLSKRKKRKGFKSGNLRFLVPLRPFFYFLCKHSVAYATHIQNYAQESAKNLFIIMLSMPKTKFYKQFIVR